MSDSEGGENRESNLYRNKWVTGYSVNSLSICKDLHCLYGEKKIPKGSLRIGRRYPSPFDPDSIAINWYHAKCIFNQQSRSRTGTQIISRLADIDGADELLLPDRQFIEELIQGNVELIQEEAKHQPTIKTPQKGPTGTTKGRESTGKKKTPASTGGGPRKSINRRDAGRILLL
jgi:hypothetical protein